MGVVIVNHNVFVICVVGVSVEKKRIIMKSCVFSLYFFLAFSRVKIMPVSVKKRVPSVLGSPCKQIIVLLVFCEKIVVFWRQRRPLIESKKAMRQIYLKKTMFNICINLHSAIYSVCKFLFTIFILGFDLQFKI